MTDKNDALFLVSLPFGQKSIPYEEVPELIAMAKSPGYDFEKASEHEALMLALCVYQEEGPLKAAVRAGEVEVLSKSLHRMGPPFIGRLEDTVLTVRALREYVRSINGFLEVDDAPATDTATPAPVVAASDGPAPPRTVTNSTKARRDTLTPVIEQAQKKCTDPSDTAAVWAALLVLAEKKNPPLIGATEDGLQYLKGGSAEIFKRKSLGQRLAR